MCRGDVAVITSDSQSIPPVCRGDVAVRTSDCQSIPPVCRGDVVVRTSDSQSIPPVCRGDVVVRTSDSQSRKPRFESACCCFEALPILVILRCQSSLTCTNVVRVHSAVQMSILLHKKKNLAECLP